MYEQVQAYKFNGTTYQFASLMELQQDIDALQTSTFESTADQTWKWNPETDIAYFLTRGSYRTPQSNG